MQSDEIIRDLQSVQTLAMLHAADSRSKDCGNDGFFFMINYLAGHPGNFVAVKQLPSMQSAEIIRDLQSAATLAILRAVDSRSKDCGNDGFFFYSVHKR
jgi:aminoglycoside phosphotransferase (APT) family kinase protein